MNWDKILEIEKNKDYYKVLEKKLDNRYISSVVYPNRKNIFNAFKLTPIDKIKIVIIGQDPYHQKGQAQGLAFSTPCNIKNPPSLRNILKEIELEYGCLSLCSNGDLTSWANQGVLLLNSILTVEESQPSSHQNIGWEIFTNNIIKYISNNSKNIVFMLWGNYAIKKQILIDHLKHHILTAPHPSPLSAYRGFFGCNHFVEANNILSKYNKNIIKW